MIEDYFWCKSLHDMINAVIFDLWSKKWKSHVFAYKSAAACWESLL